MRALSAAGRVPDALQAYQDHARVLRDQLGLDPTPELRDLHARILREDLDAGARPATGTARLPRRPSDLIGRLAELSALAAEPDAPELVTLVGPGGVGKTRVALELAHHRAGAGRPVWWVDLVPITPPRVVDAIAAATGVEIAPGPDRAGALCAVLSPSEGLLVLDNAEHLLDTLALWSSVCATPRPGWVCS